MVKGKTALLEEIGHGATPPPDCLGCNNAYETQVGQDQFLLSLPTFIDENLKFLGGGLE
jgi:hypothetical protein